MYIPENNKIINILGVDKNQAYISKENNNKTITLLSKLYKDTIGSPIVEAVCNAFDSQDNDIPIIVSHENGYIHIKDSGCGITPFQMKTVVFSYGESTKSDSDIGKFGLGAKAVIAYTDIFFINSVVDGTEYQYQIIHQSYKGVNWLLLNEFPTTKINGTDVFYRIKSGDYYSFEKALQDKLKYSKNIIVTGFDFDNHFKVFETDNYIYSTLSHNDYLEISLGGVKYDIDFNLLGINIISVKGALKFSLTEGLTPIPSREAIEYTPENIKLIKDKIEVVKAELIELYLKQFKPEYNSFGEIIEESKKLNNLRLPENINIYLNSILPYKSLFKHSKVESFVFRSIRKQDLKDIYANRKYSNTEFNYFKTNLERKELRKFVREKGDKIITKEVFDRRTIYNSLNLDNFAHYPFETIVDVLWEELPLFEETHELKEKSVKKPVVKLEIRIKNKSGYVYDTVEHFLIHNKKQTNIFTTDNQFIKNFKNLENLKCFYVSKVNYKKIIKYGISEEQFLNSKFYKKQLCLTYLHNIPHIDLLHKIHGFDKFKKSTIIQFKADISDLEPNQFHFNVKNHLKIQEDKNQEIEDLRQNFRHSSCKPKLIKLLQFLKQNNYKI